MSGYLELARQAATQEERRETAESQTRKGGAAYPARGQSPAFAHEPDHPGEEPNPPVTERDESDISDQSSDYRAVAEVLRDPPYWLRDSYMVGYRCGTLGLHALSAAVAAAMGRSPYAWVERLKPVVEQVLKNGQRQPTLMTTLPGHSPAPPPEAQKKQTLSEAAVIKAKKEQRIDG